MKVYKNDVNCDEMIKLITCSALNILKTSKLSPLKKEGFGGNSHYLI